MSEKEVELTIRGVMKCGRKRWEEEVKEEERDELKKECKRDLRGIEERKGEG